VIGATAIVVFEVFSSSTIDGLVHVYATNDLQLNSDDRVPCFNLPEQSGFIVALGAWQLYRPA
jgi:hypothetical protein